MEEIERRGKKIVASSRDWMSEAAKPRWRAGHSAVKRVTLKV